MHRQGPFTMPRLPVAETACIDSYRTVRHEGHARQRRQRKHSAVRQDVLAKPENGMAHLIDFLSLSFT
jgi:hypothetical protein